MIGVRNDRANTKKSPNIINMLDDAATAVDDGGRVVGGTL